MVAAEHHLADAAWRAASRSKLRWTRQARDGLAGEQAPGAEAAALGAYARPTWPPVLEQSAAKGSLDRTARSRSHKRREIFARHRNSYNRRKNQRPASATQGPAKAPSVREDLQLLSPTLLQQVLPWSSLIHATCSPESVDERTCHQSMVSQMLWLLLRRSSQSWPACNINSGWATQHHRSS